MKKLVVLLGVLAGLLLAVTTVAAAKSTASAGASAAAAPVNLQILSLSDWHAALEPVGVGTPPVNTGGAAVIASYWKQDREANPNTLAFTAGDAYGAAPPISSFFDEEPAVRALRMLGINADTFGNHNFDRGISHLQRMIDLAKDKKEVGTPFRYIVSNLDNVDANLDGVRPFEIFTVDGVQVGVIGAMNEEAPELVKPGSFGTLEILDAATSVNHWARVVRNAGADVVLVITHKGLRGLAPQPFGEAIDLANAVEGVDVILADHTDVQYAGVHNGVLVVETRSKGLSYAKTQLTYTPGAGVTSKSASFVVPVASAVTPDPAIQAMINDLKAQLTPILGTVIGSSTVQVTRADQCGRSDGRLCESKVGNATTDAMRFAYGTDFAITNSGGLRDALTCPQAGGGTGFCPAFTAPPWLITRGQVLAVLPFGNVAATLPINGSEVKQYLEHGVSVMPGANGRFAQVSGLCFAYEITAPVGSRVTTVSRQAPDGTCAGGPVDLSSSASYTLATNDFMAGGGDGFPNLISRATTREILDQVLADYVTAGSPISPAIQGRITCQDANGATAPNCPVTLP